jgi:uncharacterized protein (TIGR02757 family)
MAVFRNKKELREFLEEKVTKYNCPSFIAKDPISVPHCFNKKQDIEIAGLFASIFAWGNRTTIIQKSNEVMNGMDNAPYDFVINHRTADLKKFLTFRHRTFNTTDLLYFIRFLKSHYLHSDSLESAFLQNATNEKIPLYPQVSVNTIAKPDSRLSNSKIISKKQVHDLLNSKNDSENDFIKNALSVFYKRFFSLEGAPYRTRKHVACPEKKSTCKRLNMYLRWMVRQDKSGVDFGIWKKISAADLICPVDLHVARVARGLGLINRKLTDWETAMELTIALRGMDKNDPVKYDFALFGMGAMEKY